MRIRDRIKRYLPSYRTEERLIAKLDSIKKDIREMDSKHEYLYWLSQMQPGETMQQTKERMFLRMPKATGRLRNIQIAENYILQRVKDICDENDMHLFLVGGTLIGAVRHKGFIPWDNDIDIGMMKHDFIKLQKILDGNDELVAQYCYNYKEGLKVCKVKFRAVDVFWIDILLFDYIDVTPKNLDSMWVATQKANKEHSAKIREFAAEKQESYYCRPMADADLDKKILEFEQLQARAFPYFGKGDYFCEPISCPWWSRDERGIRLVEDYYPLLQDEVEFEGRKYEVWKNYDRALELAYGDIWKLPLSLKEPHSTEFDEGLEEGFEFLRVRGII